LGRNPLYCDVFGAPFKIGERVAVTNGVDDTFDSFYRGRVGVVEYLEYECGCGQRYPDDPMIGVRFSSDRVEEFWAEELALRPDTHRRSSTSVTHLLTD
jgi:hypothetical protein